MGLAKKKTIKQIKEVLSRTPERILVFGAGGYLGRMICDQFCSSPDVREIVAIDNKPMPDILKRKKKIRWLELDLAAEGWGGQIKDFSPDVAINAAWDMENRPDGMKNVHMTENIFEYCFGLTSLKKIIYLSSILPYGAASENNRERLFAEGEMLREVEYPYASRRREAEAVAARLYSASNRTKSFFVLRPGMIYGPMSVSVGGPQEPLYKAIKSLPSFFESSEDFGLQCVHEDDLIDLIAVLTFNNVPFKGYEVFNVVAKDTLHSGDIASWAGKPIFKMPPFFIRLFVMIFGKNYSEEAGKAGVWKYLCYPVFADGGKLAKKLKFELLYSAKEAFGGRVGRYDYLAPQKEEPKVEIEEEKIEEIKEE